MSYANYLKVENGKLLTTVNIPKDIPICQINGVIDNNINDALIEVGKIDYVRAYIGLSGDLIDHARHSCNPNMRVDIIGKRVIFYSLYEIRSGSELTWDYSTSSTESKDTWLMNCNCGSQCRKEISGYQYLSKDKIEEYKKRKMFPMHILMELR